MSSTNKTANYKLSQFIGTDKPTFLGDYNNDMDIIDGAIFSASQSAEQALNDVTSIKAAQEELKTVHEETQKQVDQLEETANGITGNITEAQKVANEAEKQAASAQQIATNVVNAANAASANATKALQTARGNETTLKNLDERVKALEDAPEPVKIISFVTRLEPNNRSIENTYNYISKPNNAIFKSITVNSLRVARIYLYKDDNINSFGDVAAGATNTFENVSDITQRLVIKADRNISTDSNMAEITVEFEIN